MQTPNDASPELTSHYYIGVMSGTSIDGLDIALARVYAERFELVDTLDAKLPLELQAKLHQLCESHHQDLIKLGELDIAFGRFIAAQINQLLVNAKLSAGDIRAVGSHGQTIYHHPDAEHAFTLQIGNGSVISELTGIPTVTDFRMADMSAGGQGAPLAPAFHNAVFRSRESARFIINLGGISNVTLLPSDPDSSVIGFDIGPANTLMDSWVRKQKQLSYDKAGLWARTGTCNSGLLSDMLNEPYFSKAAPKSTGRELFNEAWLDKHLKNKNTIPAEDVQRTLLELSAQSITHTLEQIVDSHQLTNAEIYCCGGGVRNEFLMDRLRALLSPLPVEQTAALGIDADWVEAGAFAWLAHQRIEQLPGNLPSVTGASKGKVLGALYLP